MNNMECCPARITPELVSALQAHLHYDINVLKKRIEVLEKRNNMKDELIHKLENLNKELENYHAMRPEKEDKCWITEWINTQCMPADNITDTDGETQFAPGRLQNLFDEFKDWFDDHALAEKQPDKKQFKTKLIEWQQKSPYGYVVGKNKSDMKVNGCKSTPLFNLRLRNNETGEEDPNFIYE
jgi:hypothetical protein